MSSNSKASDFQHIADFVINHIKTTFKCSNHIAETLRIMAKIDTDIWKPTLNSSTDTDATIRLKEDRQFQIEYKVELNAYMKRKQDYQENLFKAYRLL